MQIADSPPVPARVNAGALGGLPHRNTPARRIEQALANLAAAGKATRQRTLTAGRPAELWTARTP